MMKINYLAILLLLMFIITSCSQMDRAPEPAYLNHVGDTVFDPNIDNTEFKVCHDDLVLQYYNFGSAIQYEGEKYAIEQSFKTAFSMDKKINENGFVSIRFIVNCEGDTGWFRVEEVDMEYEYKKFDTQLISQLLAITKSLDGWKIGEYDGRIYDYYQYLTFKIEDGLITGITP